MRKYSGIIAASVLLLLLVTVRAFNQQEVHRSHIARLELPKYSPHDQVITHSGYTLSYNPVYRIANWVAYELTAGETHAVVQRKNHFAPDPLLNTESAVNEDYKGSGYDRGHLAPCGDMCWSYQAMTESFYLSNMSPQVPAFNRGIWKKLEEQVRDWAIEDQAVCVVTGPVLTKGLGTIGHHRIAIPEYFYKVILDYTEPGIKGIGFIIPNAGSSTDLQHYAVTIDSVEKLTQIDFFWQLPDSEEKIIEGKMNVLSWTWKK
jgi:endonuclease G, mitochondrial